jgi:FSR family fosmidomycin resistance protein-like MFS transporter
VSLPVATRPASRPTLFALSLGHGCADLCSGALWTLLPFLVVERHYSYGAVGLYALAASLATAVVQPLVGAHGDRGEARWLLPAGLVLAGAGIGAVGLTASYPLTLIAAIVCSIGVAAYHPEGARWARFASGSRVTANMSVFSVGGGLGYAVGPLLVAAVLSPLGLHGTLLIALVPLAAAVVVVAALSHFRQQTRDGQEAHRLAASASEWRPFATLVVLFCVASGVTTGLLTYVPLFLVHARATTPGVANIMTAILLAAAAAGTLLGGLAAQRFGRRFVVLVPQLVLVPVIALLPSMSYGAMIPLVIVIGLAMNANVGVSLVLAQEYLPRHMGLATGLTIGLCSGAGGLVVAALGLLGDAAGPASVLYAIAALPLVAAGLAALLPRPAAAPPGTRWGWRRERVLSNR